MSKLLTITVDLRERSYPIYIGEGLINKKLIHKHLRNKQVFIITDDTISNLYLPLLRDTLSEYECDDIILLPGEKYKTLDSFSQIIDALVEKGHRRTTTLIALGGGVIGDLTGFVAACYQRGVDFIQVPTTLLAQVDASIGGKTGINHPKAKNRIGIIHQPKAVVIDIKTLQTLPQREFCSGLAEIIKASLILDINFFTWIEENLADLLEKKVNALSYAIQKACSIKAKIVALDEKEQGARALLNLGHTFGHAIEQALGYGKWLHGEAVAVGLVLAAEYSYYSGLLNKESVHRIKNLLTKAKLPIRLPSSISASRLIAEMSLDKKKETEQLKLILLEDLGHAMMRSDIDMSLLEQTIVKNISF